MLKIKIFFPSNERNRKYLGQPFIPDSTEVCRHSSLFLNPSVYLFKSFPIFNMLFKAKDANLSVSFLMTNVWSVKSGNSLTMVEYWSSSKPMQYTHVHLEYMYVHRCSFINMHCITPNIIDGSHFKRKKKNHAVVWPTFRSHHLCFVSVTSSLMIGTEGSTLATLNPRLLPG